LVLISTLFLPADPSDKATLKPEILKDQKTGVIYYLESDHCNLVAISPEGKLLWSLQVMNPSLKQRGYSVGGLGFWQKGNFPPMDGSKGEDCIVIGGFVGTMLTMVINKNTGKMAGAIGE
jgi:hypothetical protein